MELKVGERYTVEAIGRVSVWKQYEDLLLGREVLLVEVVTHRSNNNWTEAIVRFLGPHGDLMALDCWNGNYVSRLDGLTFGYIRLRPINTTDPTAEIDLAWSDHEDQRTTADYCDTDKAVFAAGWRAAMERMKA